jgi:hypothetical protein
MLADSWEVHGILVLVTHRSTVLDGFLESPPVKPLAVLGYFQSWSREETVVVEDMLSRGLLAGGHVDLIAKFKHSRYLFYLKKNIF